MRKILRKIKTFIAGLVYDEYGNPSLSDCVVLAFATVFLGVSVDLAAKGLLPYEVFAKYTVGSAISIKLTSKFINGKYYNSAPGQSPGYKEEP